MLQVTELCLGFRGVRALAGVSLSIAAGELVGIIGPNGSGKSTLFNVISGIYAPEHGDVRFRGGSIAGRDPRRIAAMGVARTFQNKRLFRSLTVLENVLIPALSRQPGGWAGDLLGRAPARQEWRSARLAAMEWLDFVGLSGAAETPAGALAYGQQNRLELARALASAPALLLLDEPAAGLTEAERAEVGALIRRIREGGVTIALVEHDMRMVMGLCSRIVALDHGEVIAAGVPAEIARHPAVIAAYLGEPADG